MKRIYVPGPNGEQIDVTPLPRWLRFLINHDLPARRANRIALRILAIWDIDAREVLRRDTNAQ